MCLSVLPVLHFAFLRLLLRFTSGIAVHFTGPAVISLDINLGGKCTSVVQFQLPGALLSKDDISEVNFILDNTNKRLLTSADQWYFDDACL